LTRNLGTHDGAGIVAERDLQLPPRDSRVTEKNQAKEQRGVEHGRALRQSGGRHS
jgi:membrane protein